MLFRPSTQTSTFSFGRYDNETAEGGFLVNSQGHPADAGGASDTGDVRKGCSSMAYADNLGAQASDRAIPADPR